MKKSLRSIKSVMLGDTNYKELESFYDEDRPLRQAPTGVMVIERIRYLCNREQGVKRYHEAYTTIAKELSLIWTLGLTIYPATLKIIEEKLKDIYEGRKGTRKVKLIYGFRDRWEGWNQKKRRCILITVS